MAITIPFAEKALESMIIESVQKVFSTMLATEITFQKSFTYAENTPPQPLPFDPARGMVVAGCVGFIGTVNGIIYLSHDEALSLELASLMLGMTPENIKAEGQQTLNDTLGEICNMTVGTFKNKLCDQGYNCRLTIPSILRGHQFSVQTTPATPIFRQAFYFQVCNQPYLLDLLMKPTT